MEKLKSKLIKYFPLIIVILGGLVYGMSLFNGFVWDDEEQVVNNRIIQSVANIPFLFTQSTFNTGGGAGMAGMYYKPLMPFMFTLIYQFSQLNAWGFHLVQLLLHLLNVYLVFLVFRKIFKPELAALAALIFLVHPGNVETVVYVSGLQDVLFMTFGLLALILVMSKSKPQGKNWAIIFGLLLLSLLSKETGILFVILIAAYLFLFVKKELSFFLRLLSLLLSLYLILRFAVAGVGVNQNRLSPIMLLPLSLRLISIPKITFFYLRLIFFPYYLAISQHWYVPQFSWPSFYLPLITVTGFFLGLLWLCFRFNSRRLWWLSFGLVIGLGMHSQLVPLDMTVSDRWLYFPLFSFLGVLAILITKLQVKHTWVFGVSVVIVILFSVRTFIRVLDWRDGLTLYLKDEPLAANNFDFENNLGVYLHRAGRFKEAIPHYQRSVKLAPHWWTNWNNLGVSYLLQGQEKKAEKAFLKSIENGDYYLAYENYSNILVKQKRYAELKLFLEKQALPKFPYNNRLREFYQFVQAQNAR